MKTSRRILAALLALVLAFAAIPAASAATLFDVIATNNRYVTYMQPDGSCYVCDRITGAVITSWSADVPTSKNHLHEHAFGFDINRDGHFIGCSCGIRGAVDPHLDPKDAEDGKCWCGYTYMTNADLTVMWFSGMTLSPRFTGSKTEYTARVWNPNLTELTGTIKSMDARATIEWPEDLTIKEGTNTFEIKVTAEDGKTTKTYTVTFEK